MNRALAAITLLAILSISGCGARNAGAVEAANKWWRDTLDTVAPEKAGTITPAHEVKTATGKVYKLKRHVQTKAEEASQVEDVKWATRLRAMVSGFGVEGKTLLVLTNLTSANTKDAQELCDISTGFLWEKDTRQQFGLENIKVLGPRREILSYRYGLQGSVY